MLWYYSGGEHTIGKRGGAMTENPFFHRGPIRDPAYFYNRKREVKWVLEMLGKGQSVSITGPRKVGKTSLLFHISRPEVMQQHGVDPARYLFVYFDCEGLGSLKQEEFYALILEQIADRAAQQGYALAESGRSISYLEFERILRKACEHGFKVALLLDEFELLGSGQDRGGEFLAGLRALATKFGIAYLTASQRRLAAFTGQHSPFFNIFVPLRLGLFDRVDSLQMMEESLAKGGTALRPEVINHILELGGRHPFFLQVVGYSALELQAAKGAALDRKDFRTLAQNVRVQVESHFEYYWRHLTPRERYVLAALSLTQEEEMYREELESLVCLCLIVKENAHYTYFSPLFRDFMRRQKVENLLQAGPFVLSTIHRQILLREKLLPLSTTQFALLSYLMERQGQVVSNEELDREVMGTSSEEQQKYEYLSDERLKSAIKGLRKALGREAGCIVNKRGVGYIFRLPAEE